MRDHFDQYVEEGRALIEQHPDFDPSDWTNSDANIDAETAAIDNIATILHGIIGREHDRTRAQLILNRALGCFVGDYEEKGMPPVERGGRAMMHKQIGEGLTVGELRRALESFSDERPVRIVEVYDEPDEYVLTDVTAKQVHFPAPSSSDAAAVTLWIAIREEVPA